MYVIFLCYICNRLSEATNIMIMKIKPFFVNLSFKGHISLYLVPTLLLGWCESGNSKFYHIDFFFLCLHFGIGMSINKKEERV